MPETVRQLTRVELWYLLQGRPYCLNDWEMFDVLSEAATRGEAKVQPCQGTPVVVRQLPNWHYEVSV